MDFYRRYGPAVLRKCERMLGNRQDAEDIVQNLFIDLIRKGRTDVGLAYLYRAATTRSLNVIRNRKRRQELLDRHGEALRPRGMGTEGEVVTAELLAELARQLDPKTLEILVYAHQDHMSQQEIATLCGLSRKTVGKRLQRARVTLESLAGGAP